MVIAYDEEGKRSDAIKRVQSDYPSLSYADAELMWMAIDEALDKNG